MDYTIIGIWSLAILWLVGGTIALKAKIADIILLGVLGICVGLVIFIVGMVINSHIVFAGLIIGIMGVIHTIVDNKF